MLLHVLLVIHIAVLGYWLGSELVINSTYRYVSMGAGIPFVERDRLMEHVMDVDQHVRYALVLQAGLGFTLATLYGYLPGGAPAALMCASLAVIWLAFVEVIHRLRHRPEGRALAKVDRVSRYVLMAVLVAIALGLVIPASSIPLWLRIKLGLFACVIASGVGIRLALIGHFRTWAIMAREGPSDRTNKVIRRTYWQATLVLIGLWVFIGALVCVSVLKPA